MTKTSWVERESNEIVLSEENEGRSLLKVIGKRQAKIIGHLLRHNKFLTKFSKISYLEKRREENRELFSSGMLKKKTQLTLYCNFKRTDMEKEMRLKRQGIAFR